MSNGPTVGCICDSSDESLDALHADLALADTWVADSVIPYVERGIYQPARVDVVDELGTLCKRAAALRDRVDGPEPDLSDSYSNYAKILLRVYEDFLARGDELRRPHRP